MNAMCNIAGYVGNRPAAPVLIEMMRREEGWNGGCYTGIATLHEGRLYYAKLTGDLENLICNTDACCLPGNIGILHSRTPSGGGDEWAHPFMGGRGELITTAYVANGAAGCFSDRLHEISAQALRLEREGYTFRSREENAVGKYPTLSDGDSVHMSDVMAQLITEKIDVGMDASCAMDSAFCEMPSEIVGLMLSLAEQDCIMWSRINMPMFVGFAEHGAYLASTPQAFLDDAGESTMLPACSGGRVYPGHYTVSPYICPPAKVAPVTPGVLKNAYAALEDLLSKSACTFSEMAKAVNPLFEKADCTQANALVYWILSAFEKEGRLIVERRTKEGVFPGLTAPVFLGKLTD